MTPKETIAKMLQRYEALDWEGFSPFDVIAEKFNARIEHVTISPEGNVNIGRCWLCGDSIAALVEWIGETYPTALEGLEDDSSDADTVELELITTSALLDRLGIDAAMRAELTAAHGPIPERFWTRDQIAALADQQPRQSTIVISANGYWAGTGILRDGIIEDCGAQFCPDNDRSLRIYDDIESAIAAGKDSLEVEIDGETMRISWAIHPQD